MLRSGKPGRRVAGLLYWALGIVGALLAVRWATAPAWPVATQGQLERARATGVVYGEQRLGQIVLVPRDGLSAVQFWLLAHRRDGGGNVVLRVASPSSPKQELARVSLPLAEIPQGQPATFMLPSFNRATTPVLVLTLEAPGLDRAHAPSVLGANNAYSNGSLLVNGEQRLAEDLAFQLFAPRVQGDQLLPFSRLGLSRPGPLGLPALYLTLLWMLLWSYGWVLLRMFSWILHRHQG